MAYLVDITMFVVVCRLEDETDGVGGNRENITRVPSWPSLCVIITLIRVAALSWGGTERAHR